jgi:hypothetical protein
MIWALLFSFLSSAQDIRCEDFKKFPAMFKGCQGEACGLLSYDRIIQEIDLHQIASLKSKKLATLERCQKIESVEPHTVLLGFGRAKITKIMPSETELGLKVGDFVKLVFYEGDGFFKGCFNNKLIDLATTDTQDLTTTNVDVVQKISSGTWYKVKSADGKEGFARNAPFFMGHFNFDVDKLCPGDHPLGANPEAVRTSISKILSQNFEKYCPKFLKCLLNRSADQTCSIDSEFWPTVLKQLPANLNCSQLVMSEQLCLNQWDGGFQCPTNLESGEKTFPMNFSCKKSHKIECQLKQ